MESGGCEWETYLETEHLLNRGWMGGGGEAVYSQKTAEEHTWRYVGIRNQKRLSKWGYLLKKNT